jgi:hypothetical protein
VTKKATTVTSEATEAEKTANEAENTEAENAAAENIETENTEVEQTNATEQESLEKPAEVTEKESFTRDEHEAAVAVESSRAKVAEDALAAQAEELEALKTASANSETALAEAKQTALYWELAYSSKLDLEDLNPLKELPEKEFRATVATIVKAAEKAAKAAPKPSHSDLFDGKDYTKPEKTDRLGFLNKRYPTK